jgi:hypothetical protein
MLDVEVIIPVCFLVIGSRVRISGRYQVPPSPGGTPVHEENFTRRQIGSRQSPTTQPWLDKG